MQDLFFYICAAVEFVSLHAWYSHTGKSAQATEGFVLLSMSIARLGKASTLSVLRHSRAERDCLRTCMTSLHNFTGSKIHGNLSQLLWCEAHFWRITFIPEPAEPLISEQMQVLRIPVTLTEMSELKANEAGQCWTHHSTP